MAVFEENIIGIDLGTTNTLLCAKKKGVIMREPSVVTYDSASKRVLAVGNEAKPTAGKTQSGIYTIAPLCEGVIADYELACVMLKSFLKKAGCTFLSRPKTVVCVPGEVTEIERRALEQAAYEAGASSVILTAGPLAAAVGAGLPVKAARGGMIVDIGGGTTEIAVISAGTIIHSVSLRVAGNYFDHAIIQYIRRKFGVQIGTANAEEIKIAAGSAHFAADKGLFEAKGQNLSSGLAAVFSIDSSEIREAIGASLAAIADGIRTVLEHTSPELCADIYDTGITLGGGGALLEGIGLFLEDSARLPVYLAKKPLDCVIDGIYRIMGNPSYACLLNPVKRA